MIKYVLIFFLFPLKLFSQDVSGVWTGTLFNDTTKKFIRYELAISEDNGKLSGFSHTIFIIDSIRNIGVKSVKIKKAGNDYLVEDDKLIYNNYSEPPAKGVKTFSDLVFSENDSALFLRGHWKTNPTRNYKPLTGTIFLQKKKDIEQTLIIPKLDSLGLARSLSFYQPPPKSSELEIASSQVAGKNESEQSNPVNIEKEKRNVRNNDRHGNEKFTNTDIAGNEKDLTVADVENKKRRPGKIENATPTSKTDDEESFVPSKKKISKVAPPDKKAAPQDLQKRKSEQVTTIQTPLVPPAADVATRKVETIRSVEIKSDSLILSLFDNGEIDGDTVSILLNGKVIMAKQGLMSRAINKTIYLSPEMSDSITLIMYAENLGSIPPNTGLMVIHDGDDIYEIRFSGDLKKSSAIVLRRKQKL